MKKYVLMFFAALLFMTMPVLLLHGGAAGAGVRSGLELAYRSVLPALFPAMVVCGMIGETAEYLPLPPALAIWINGHLCGFPLGIKTLARAYHRGLLTRRQTIRLSACCANASPAFLVLYAGQSVLGSRQEGILLLLGQVMISLGAAVCSGALEDTPTLPAEERPLLRAAADSIAGAALGSLTLTGYIVFFSAVAALCNALPGFSYLYGFLELTGGLAALPEKSASLALTAAIIGFSGLSVLLQNAVFLMNEQLPVRYLVAGKVLYALLLPPLTLLLSRLGCGGRVLFCALFLLFLFSFDKLRMKYYNNSGKTCGRRKGIIHDLFQRS